MRHAFQPLSPRQAQVLDKLVEGLTNKEIAQAMDIAGDTVKTHLTQIMLKLGVSTRIQAAVIWSKIRPRYVKTWQVSSAGTLPEVLPEIMLPENAPLLPSEQFWVLVDKEDRPSHCWIWRGSARAENEPVCTISALRTLGHSARRVSYALAVGKALPKQLCLTMTCNTSCCVNPEHMKVTALGHYPEYASVVGRAFDAYLTNKAVAH